MRKYVARLLVLSLCLCMGCFCSRSNNGKEGTWRGGKKKRGFCCSISQTVFPVPLSQVNSTFHDPSLPLSSQTHPYNIQNYSLSSFLAALTAPLVPPPHFPHPLLSQRLSPSLETAVSTGFQFLATICKILWPKEHRSPEAAILILLHGTGVNSEQSSQPCAHTALLGLSLNA